MTRRPQYWLIALFISLSASVYAGKGVNSQSISATYDFNMNYFQIYSEDNPWKAKPIVITVKLYENGDVYLDEFQFSSARYVKTYNDGNYEVDAKIFGLYKEELGREIGYEQGTRYLDLNIAKVIKLDSIDDITYRIEGSINVDGNHHITTNEDNRLFESRAEQDFRRNSLNVRYGVGVKATYDMGDSEVNLGASYSQYNNDGFRNDENKTETYEISRKESKIELSYRPNKKKCHQFRLGVRKIDYDQNLNNSGSDFSETEVYGNYYCYFNMMDLFYPKDNNEGNLIRY